MEILHLAFKDDFLAIFENNEIVDWEAKQFWEKIEPNTQNNKTTAKVMMYRSLRNLVKYKYLKKRKSPKNRKINLYTGTSHLVSLLNSQFNQDLYGFLQDKIPHIEAELENIEFKIKYLDDLISANFSLEYYTVEYKNKLNIKMKELKLKLEVLKEIINVT